MLICRAMRPEGEERLLVSSLTMLTRRILEGGTPSRLAMLSTSELDVKNSAGVTAGKPNLMRRTGAILMSMTEPVGLLHVF